MDGWLSHGNGGKRCEPRKYFVPEILHGCPLLFRETIANRPQLHEHNFLMPILPHGRGRQSIDVFGFYVPKDIFEGIGSGVMAFVHDDHAVIGYSLVNFLITAKRGNHRHIDKAMEGIMPGIERPHDATRLPLAFPYFNGEFLADFQKPR